MCFLFADPASTGKHSQGGFQGHHPLVNFLTYGTPQSMTSQSGKQFYEFDGPTTSWISIVVWWVYLAGQTWWESTARKNLLSSWFSRDDYPLWHKVNDYQPGYRLECAGAWSTNQQAFEPFDFLPHRVNTLSPVWILWNCAAVTFNGSLLKCYKALFWLVGLGLLGLG